MSAGQVFFRDAGKHSSGKSLMYFIGVMNDLPFKPEHKYTARLVGYGTGNWMIEIIEGSEFEEIEAVAFDANRLLLSAGWRIGE